jgi:TonB-linked SusC/RagA family outer membrane protein
MNQNVIFKLRVFRAFNSCIKKATFLFGLCMFFGVTVCAQNIKITGSVTNVAGVPLPGVSVIEIGTQNGTATDFDGLFTIEANPSSTLQFTYFGMINQKIALNGKIVVDVVLAESQEKLDEVVIVGYGTQSRSTITSSVAKVEADETRASSNGNALVSLQGKVAGMEVRVTTGQPGASPSVLIRGGTSTSPGNDNPLYVIDGVLRDNMNDFNPEDIESFQVLKDAAAASIYGARAANGVVLITSKKGKISKKSYGKINLKYSSTIETQAKKYDWSSARDYLWASRTAANQGFDTAASIGRNDTPSHPYGTGNANYNGRQGTGYGNSISTTEFIDDLIGVNGQAYVADLLDYQGYETMTDPVTGRTLIYKDANYQDIMFQNAVTSDLNLGFEGGNENGSFYASLGYLDQQGLLYKTEYNRLNFGFNGTYKIKDNLSVDASVLYSNRTDNGETNSDTERSAKLPQTTRIYRDNGEPSIGEGGGSPRSILHAREYRVRSNENSRYTFRMGLDWEILKNVHFKPSASLYKTDNIFMRFERTNPYTTNRDQRAENNAYNQKSLDLLLSYKKSFLEKHNFDIIAGFNSIDEHGFDLSGDGANAATDNIITLNASATEDERTSSSISNETTVSWFSRVNYNYDKKYLLTLSYRIDGSSVFAPNHRYAHFPSISGGWNLHKEKFWSNSKINNIISSFKARASWGSSGNDNIPRSATQGNYSTGRNYALGTGILATNIPNADLVWETTSSFDVGFDMGLLNNRYTAFVDFYDKRTKDRLTGYPLASQTGFSSITSNVGTVQNKGLEIGIEANLIRKENFNWKLGLTYSRNITTVLELPENGVDKNRIGGTEVWNIDKGIYETVGGTAEGERIGQRWVYQFEGIYQTDAEAALAPTDTQVSGSKVGVPKQAGDSKWLDKDENGIIDSRDLVFIGYANPDRVGSIINTFSHKNLTFRTVMTYGLGHVISNKPRYRANANARNRVATTNDVTNGNIWWGPGFEPYEGYDRTKAIYPRYSAASDWDNGFRNHMRNSPIGNGGGSDNSAYIEKGDYLSFQEVSLNYRMSDDFIKKMKIEGLEFGVSVFNLGFITNYEGLKPDQYDGVESGDYPNPLRLTFSTRLTF